MKPGRYQKLFGVGPLGFLISTVLFVLLWLLDRRLGHVKIAGRPHLARNAGIILLVLWGCWHVWSIRTIRTWWFHDRLCTDGPFRYVRHPMYAGALFLGEVAVALLFNSWIMMLCPVLVYPTLSFLVRKEERMVKEVFGEEYERYVARTGRLFPRLF